METFLFVETISMFSIFVIGHHQFNVNENLISFWNIYKMCDNDYQQVLNW